MPLYLYKCKTCGKEVEVERSIKDSEKGPEKECQCGNTSFTRWITKTAFVLKGGGWYKDGYK